MKKIFSLFCILALGLGSHGQSVDDVGKISLSVVMPENLEGLDASQLSKLETKIMQILTSSGFASTGFNNTFVIYPKFAVIQTDVVEGGMQNIHVVNADISFFVKQVETNVLFSSISKTIKGSGTTKKAAMSDVIAKIPTKDPELNAFIEASKRKIIKYYELNCSNLMKKSDGLVQMQQYEQALGLLMSVPQEVSSCYGQAQAKAIQVYKVYQSQQCATSVQKAETALAANDYHGALEILSKIDPSATCFKKAQSLVKSVETKIDAEEKKQWDFQMKAYNDAVSLEKKRIDAVKDMAVAYYKSQTPNINYTMIIK